MKNILIFITGLLLCSACSPKVSTQLPERKPRWESTTKEKAVEEKTVEEETITETSGETIEPPEPVRQGEFEKHTVPAAPVVVAGLKREPCYGKCPAFELKLYSDGMVKYHGIAHTEPLGYHSAHVGMEAIVNIQARAEAIGYFALNQQYPSTGKPQIYDVPSTTTFIKTDHQQNRIINRHDSPPDLYKFEQYIEAQFKDLNWQTIKREEF